MPGLVSTSIAEELGRTAEPPTTAAVERAGAHLRRGVRASDRAPLTWRGSRRSAPTPASLAAVDRPMSAGLFELRKDPITGWWVATIVDRDFDRSRFARAAAPIDDGGDCQNCRTPAGRRRPRPRPQGLRVPRDRHRAGAGRARPRASPRSRVAGARAAGSWRTIAAPPGEHRPLAQVGDVAEQMLAARARRRRRGDAAPPRPTTSRSSRTGAPRPAPARTTCASTCTTCR